jgi:hypothetical protein
MEQVEQLESQKRELLGILSATLWVLEHPDVNAIRFSGNPRELAQRIRLHLERGGMAFANSKPANAGINRRP